MENNTSNATDNQSPEADSTATTNQSKNLVKTTTPSEEQNNSTSTREIIPSSAISPSHESKKNDHPASSTATSTTVLTPSQPARPKQRPTAATVDNKSSFNDVFDFFDDDSNKPANSEPNSNNNDGDDEDNDEADLNVLKNLDSNVKLPAAVAASSSNVSMSIAGGRVAGPRATADSAKYSCSLPRDIPLMMTMGLRSAQSAQKAAAAAPLDENDEDERQVTNNRGSHYGRGSSAAVPMLDEEDEENYLSQAGNELDKYELEGGAVNIGEAISNLASSIVVKDGRELFGGVPSRRIPINSISQSYF
jgi:hypothetical protein